MDNLLKKIEYCRDEMIRLSHSHDLTSEVMIQSSAKLDMLLNEYDKTTKHTAEDHVPCYETYPGNAYACDMKNEAEIKNPDEKTQTG